MQTIIISIHPQHVKNIFDGKKTLEIRKRVPKCGYPYKAIIYETKNSGGSGMLVGEFTVPFFKKLGGWEVISTYGFRVARAACLSHSELYDYGGVAEICALKIQNPIKYNDPVPLSHCGLKRPPQSWQYLKGADDEQNKRVNRQVNISERHY